jgi:two-component system, response regulator YesN
LKLLIADDEHLDLETIKMIVSNNAKDIEIIATVSTGREAIEKSISLKPDIVFMDIYMPGISGIEAIRQIRNINSGILFIIISAYEHFDYAKEALNLGVIEYVLKPINKNKLIETIENIRKIINNKRNSILKEIELKEKMDKAIPYLEQQFISDRLLSVGSLNNIEFYENTFSMNLRYGYAMVFLLEEQEAGKEDSLKLNYQKQSFYDIIYIKLKSLCTCLIGKPGPDKIIVFIKEDDDSELTKEKAITIGNMVIEKIRDLSNLKFKIGIGRKYDVKGFVKSHDEAFKAVLIASIGSVIYYEDNILVNNKADAYLLHKEKVFLNNIVIGNINKAVETFKDIYLYLISNYCEDINSVKSKLMNLLHIVDKNLPYSSNNLDEIKETVILNILKTNNKDELRLHFLRYFSDICEKVQNQKKGDKNQSIPIILDYINNNYYYDISLKEVSKNVNFSYNYLSKVFKDEIGKSFVDYLTELRMEKSTKLLANQSLSVKEICQKIGYHDPNYYSKAFKRVIGMTPTEYRLFIGKGSSLID